MAEPPAWSGSPDQSITIKTLPGQMKYDQAKITVEDVEGDPGWYKVDMKVRPHFKYMGAFFTLSLVGKLDQ